MHYEVVFDAAQASYRDGYLCLLLLFPAAAIVWIVADRRAPSSKRTLLRRVFPYIAAGFTGFLAIGGITLSWYNAWEFRARLSGGQYEVVEGVVTEFSPMPWEGHKPESFVVNGRRYEYSDFEDQPGFHNAQSHGGPIRSGLWVRIADIDGQIARLEIARGEGMNERR
jgi:hypothetical protein